MAEIAPGRSGIGNGTTNRTFLLIVGGLAGLLVLGLIALAGFLFLPGLLNAVFGSKPAVAQVLPTATATRVVINTATPVPPTATPFVLDTATPTQPRPTATATVIGSFTSAGGAGTIGQASPPVSGDQLPTSGLGEDLVLLAAGLALVSLVFMVRRVRLSE